MLKGMTGSYGFILPEALKETLGNFSQTLTSLGWKFAPLEYSRGPQDLIVMVIFTLAVWYLPNTQQMILEHKVKNGLQTNWRPRMVWAISLSFLFIFSTLQLSRLSEFLYFQF